VSVTLAVVVAVVVAVFCCGVASNAMKRNAVNFATQRNARRRGRSEDGAAVVVGVVVVAV